MRAIYFKPAPLCTSIKVVTVFVSTILLAMPILLALELPTSYGWSIAIFCVAVWFLCLLSVVRGYLISNGSFSVQRLLWSNDFLLTTDAEAYFNKPSGLTLRVFGNGGCFSGSGYFWNKKEGMFRAFITDPKKLVWIKTGGQKLLISPDAPKEFIEALSNNNKI